MNVFVEWCVLSATPRSPFLVTDIVHQGFLLDENDESESRDSLFKILCWCCGIRNSVWNDFDRRSRPKFIFGGVVKIDIVILACEALDG